MANIFDRLVERIEQRLIAALEPLDEAERCPKCGGEGYIVVADGIHEDRCPACDGSGMRSEEGK